MLKKALTFVCLTCLYIPLIFGQTVINGLVKDSDTNEPLIQANIVVMETQQLAVSDAMGKFSIELNVDLPVELRVSYIGYSDKKILIESESADLIISLSPQVIPGQEVVVSASRISERIMESPVTIERMSIRDIEQAASGNFYETLGDMKGVDVVSSSLGMQIVNTRGFNTTAPVRIVQFVDGMDNQAPGLNFPVGNMVGANDLDLQSVELISGPASALYGPNAFQGVINMTTKTPYNFQGISAQIKGGERSLIEGQFRIAKAFGENERFAVKVTGSFMQADDWIADNPESNRYGDIETEQDLSAIVRQLQFDESLSQKEREDFVALNNYLDFNPIANPGKQNIEAPGYMESELSENTIKSNKLAAALHYRFNNSLEASYNYRFGNGTAIYQGANRYSINNISFQQHKLELSGRQFLVRAYTTLENAGDSYDLVFTGINLSRAGVENYISEYLAEYFDQLDSLTNGFERDARLEWVNIAHAAAKEKAQNEGWYTSESQEFDSLINAIVNNPDLESGSRFEDKSSLQHIEGQYNFNFDFADIIAGVSFRNYSPRSFGTIFSDTLVNPADTLENGRYNPNAEFVSLNTQEGGGFIQISKLLFNERLRLMGSGRVDKHMNFDLQFSPRVAAIYSPNRNHSIRVSAQSAFRMPTLQNQYILLNLGPITLKGNLNGHENLYTLESVENFQEEHDSNFVVNPLLLDTISLAPLQPEQMKTIELGYRGIWQNNFYWDIAVFYSVYEQFIGEIRVARPSGDALAGETSGEDAILTGNYELFQIPVNAKETVSSIGVYAGINYYFGSGYSAGINYSFNELNTEQLNDPIIPGFNTPKNQFGIQMSGRDVWRTFGFNAAFRWRDEFKWQSTFGDGVVPSYHTLDLQLNYRIPEWYSTVRVGASNVYNNKHLQAYGSPQIGRLMYASWTVDLGFPVRD
ncbi:MAG: TonB-dependent receptor [Chitinophagaceae bacterium]|nr:MAG: TonB-dependent receptor [Chitinophagaceae bacterium]